jgi:IclR family KDG regulon transcriptional repressor
MQKKDMYTIDILSVALDVVEFMLKSGESSLRPSEIGAQLGINRTRVFRILKTLEQRGYSEFDPDTQGFRLGSKFLEFGKLVRGKDALRRVAEPVLMKLAQTTGDSSHLLIRFQDSAITIDRFQGHHRLQVATPIGQSVPLHVGASPKILLANAPEEERETLLKELSLQRFTPNTITDINELRRCLNEIREKGYAVDEEDYERGVYAIGAPVRDGTGRVIAGITITTPESRYSLERRETLIVQVLEAAREISRRLGFYEDGEDFIKMKGV